MHTSTWMFRSYRRIVFNEETQKWELIIDENDFDIARASEDACPVQAIKVEKVED